MLKQLSVVILGSCLCVPAMASSFLSKIVTDKKNGTSLQHKALQHKSLKAEPGVETPWTDFSGSWAGTCDYGFAIDLTIENNEHFVMIDDRGYTINGLYTETDSTSYSSSASHVLMTWAEDGSLNMNGTDVEVDFSDSPVTLETTKFVSNMSLKDGQLTLAVDSKNVVMTCVMTKTESKKKAQ